MSQKTGKVWGVTELIHANGVLEFHRIQKEGGGGEFIKNGSWSTFAGLNLIIPVAFLSLTF